MLTLVHKQSTYLWCLFHWTATRHPVAPPTAAITANSAGSTIPDGARAVGTIFVYQNDVVNFFNARWVHVSTQGWHFVWFFFSHLAEGEFLASLSIARSLVLRMGWGHGQNQTASLFAPWCFAIMILHNYRCYAHAQVYYILTILCSCRWWWCETACRCNKVSIVIVVKITGRK